MVLLAGSRHRIVFSTGSTTKLCCGGFSMSLWVRSVNVLAWYSTRVSGEFHQKNWPGSQPGFAAPRSEGNSFESMGTKPPFSTAKEYMGRSRATTAEPPESATDVIGLPNIQQWRRWTARIASQRWTSPFSCPVIARPEGSIAAHVTFEPQSQFTSPSWSGTRPRGRARRGSAAAPAREADP